MLVCNQFKEVRRTVMPTDAHWADFMGNENVEGVDRCVVRGVFRIEVGCVSLSKPGKLGGYIFLCTFLNALVNFKFSW